MGERFAPLDITFEMPPTWKARPGQKPKSSKYLLYTDTYGPNYRYNRIWPKLKDEEGVAVDSIEDFMPKVLPQVDTGVTHLCLGQVVISGLSGTERITDLGPQENVDVNRAFGFQREDLTTAEVIGAVTRIDQDGQAYYEW
ncbi:hypothetical protein CYMTET_12747 [Cymbomonas tetramitiformis]|uniref:Uncharacterized protein n=1 Tax=Cymbomonas tetramitiformis TaxID=36881 RepID=A0AAE0GJV1_9CHLO|nr:hypothetical protein CYMTET_12747 [Cymbomonas tetramitiformis]